MVMVNKFLSLGRFFYSSRLFFLGELIRISIRLIFGCSIDPRTKIGKDVVFGYNGIGIVIHPNVVIGNNVTIAQNCTIGGRFGCKRLPEISDNVYIGAGAVIIGDVKIGDGAVIGANAVVTKSVPSNITVVGVPAREIKK